MKKTTFDLRTIRMSLEGWYYSFVLMFIGGAAILRRANLLLILAAMLTAPLLFNWRFVMSSMRNLVLKRRTPRLAVAGEAFRIDLTLGNMASMDSWHVQVDETLVTEQGKQSTSVAVIVDRVPFKNQTTRSYECVLWKRGHYRLRPSRISTSYPIGLVRASAKIDNGESLYVAPPQGTLSSVWADWSEPDEVDEPRGLGNKGIQDGLFYGIREFRQGDSRRAIHWRTSARLGKLAVKQFEKQTDRELNIVIDLHGTPEKSNGAELALSFAATLMEQVCMAGHCEVNLLAVGDLQRRHQGQAGPSLRESVGITLAEIQADRHENLDHRIADFLEYGKHGSPLLVISTRPSIHRDAIPLESPKHLPYYVLPMDEMDLPCCWINVTDPNFRELFIPPETLAEVRS
ncbi:MAG: DUF58 domain-containing protein [Planctomycetota bacterium]|nr:DUF58 domain-containing protein [Planctomycetota bacterium]